MKRFFLKILVIVSLLAAGLAGCALGEAPACRQHGLRLDNVMILDGSGAPAYAGNVRLEGSVISGVGEVAECEGDTVFDGQGLTLAPGFIDTHSHADEDIFDHPEALPIVSQGITTIVAGQDGGSPFPLADFFSRLEASPAAVNVASYVGHNTLREEVMGNDFRRAASETEIEDMRRILAEELDSGALGLSTGLEYEPGIYSQTDEVMALAHVAADAGSRYISHVRSEDRWFEEALDELINIGRETGMPVQISHVKLAMKRLWGRGSEIIAKLDAARAEGIEVSADIYPYEYWQSTIMVLLPERDPTDREAIAEALDQIAPPDGLWLTTYAPNPDYEGKTLTEIAEIRGQDPVTAFSGIALQALEWEERTGEEAESIIGTSMIPEDIYTLVKWPHTNICTDGSIVNRHPRSFGSFPRVLGLYAREHGLFSMAEAVRKMTGLAAHNMGIEDRGRIAEGMVADLVLFDPSTVIDHATPLDPGVLSTGIDAVWVGGELVYRSGEATGARPGKVIRRN